MGLKIDIGCGSKKKDGCLGIDYIHSPDVDYVLDVTHERLPFEDESVEYIYSSHFLEHIDTPYHLFKEIARVCCDRAKIEIWTPYAFSNMAFFYGHKAFLTEEIWLRFCYNDRDTFVDFLQGRWLLKQINYVVLPQVQQDIEQQGVTLDFAIKYLKSVVFEFGVEIEFRKALDTAPILPQKTYSYVREGERFPLPSFDMHVHDPATPQTFLYRVVMLLQRMLWKARQWSQERM